MKTTKNPAATITLPNGAVLTAPDVEIGVGFALRTGSSFQTAGMRHVELGAPCSPIGQIWKTMLESEWQEKAREAIRAA
jgi:hypothetical protein